MLKVFRDKTAVITGAGSGIGRSLVLHGLSLGMNVVAADRAADRLAELATEAHSAGRLATLVADVTDDAQMGELAEFAYRCFGEVNLLCNNAGTSSTGAAWDLDIGAWQRMMDINFMGAVRGVCAFVPRMLAAGTQGAIVNTASMSAIGAAADLAPYVASKHALLGMSESLLLDLRARGAPISVSLLCPGPVRTGIMRTDLADADTEMFRSETMRAALTAMIDGGMSPDDVATMTFAGVEAGKFWIFTHPKYLRPARDRYETMVGSGVIAGT